LATRRIFGRLIDASGCRNLAGCKGIVVAAERAIVPNVDRIAGHCCIQPGGEVAEVVEYEALGAPRATVEPSLDNDGRELKRVLDAVEILRSVYLPAGIGPAVAFVSRDGRHV